jgi:hypothetical protein
MATVLTESLALRRAWAWTPVGLALATIPALNLHQLLVVGPSRLVTNPETLTRKILHEHPASIVTEVCERPNDVRQLFLSMYPSEEARFRFSTVAAVETPPRQEGPEARFPIYLVHDPALVRPLREKLGEDYRTEDEWDGAHETHAVVFLPRP